MLPYVVTILVLVFISLRRKREDQPPPTWAFPISEKSDSPPDKKTPVLYAAGRGFS